MVRDHPAVPRPLVVAATRATRYGVRAMNGKRDEKQRDEKAGRPKARLPRGFRDRGADEIAAERAMLDAIRGVYERYGFDALETPAFEYTDALGKFLPDIERPNEGVFRSRMTTTSGCARLRPDRTLRVTLPERVSGSAEALSPLSEGYGVRNEKPGPVVSAIPAMRPADKGVSTSPAVDAELMMMFADAMEAVGLAHGEYVIKVNSRKLARRRSRDGGDRRCRAAVQ